MTAGLRGASLVATLCFTLWLLLSGSAMAQARAQTVAVPERSALVTDLTGTLTAAQRTTLERKLADFEARHGPQIAVLLVPSTGVDSIEQYATRVFDRWKLGSAQADDGLLLLVALKDRRMRIEVGQGLEGRVPDIAAGRIIDQQMTPRFRQQDFAGGIDAAVDALMERLDNRTVPGSLPGNAMPLPLGDDASALIESTPPDEGSRITLFGWTLLAGLIGAVAAACVRWRGARLFTLGLAVVIALMTLAARYFGLHQLLIGLAVLLGSSFALLLIGVTLYGMRRAWNDSLAGFCFRLAVVAGITGYTAYETDGEPIPIALAAFFSLLFAFMPGTHRGDGESDDGSSSTSSSSSSSSSSGSSSSGSSSSGGSSSGGGASGSW